MAEDGHERRFQVFTSGFRIVVAGRKVWAGWCALQGLANGMELDGKDLHFSCKNHRKTTDLQMLGAMISIACAEKAYPAFGTKFLINKSGA